LKSFRFDTCGLRKEAETEERSSRISYQVFFLPKKSKSVLLGQTQQYQDVSFQALSSPYPKLFGGLVPFLSINRWGVGPHSGVGKGSVVELKLFVSAPALAPAQAPTFKKFLLWLQLQLCGYLFSQLLNEKADFS
jgi:hypothetical protein